MDFKHAIRNPKFGMVQQQPQDRSTWRQINCYLEIGLMFPASTVAGLLAGYGLDRLFGTHFLYWVFMLVGIAGGFVQLIRLTSGEKDSNRG